VLLVTPQSLLLYDRNICVLLSFYGDPMTYICSSFCSFYRGEEFIRGYLENMLQQTLFDQIEFIFLDCNSPDNEAQYILPLAEKFSNVRYIRLDKDPGLYAAWNIAVSLCSADIIGNWNIDDRKSPDSFEILISALNSSPEVDLVYGLLYVSTIPNAGFEADHEPFVLIDSSVESVRNSCGVAQDFGPMYVSRDSLHVVLEHTNDRLLAVNSPHCMPLWRKSLHDKFGYFDKNYFSAGDAELWLRACSMGAQMKLVAQCIGVYYRNPLGRSTSSINLDRCLKEVADMRQQYTEIFAQI